MKPALVTRCLQLFLMVLMLGCLHVGLMNKPISEGSQLESLTSSYGYQQLISFSIQILPYSLSCINLIFTDQPNLVVDTGAHPSFHPNCHTNWFIVNSVSIYNILPSSPYQHLVCDYN